MWTVQRVCGNKLSCVSFVAILCYTVVVVAVPNMTSDNTDNNGSVQQYNENNNGFYNNRKVTNPFARTQPMTNSSSSIARKQFVAESVVQNSRKSDRTKLKEFHQGVIKSYVNSEPKNTTTSSSKKYSLKDIIRDLDVYKRQLYRR